MNSKTKEQHTPRPWQVMGYIRPHGKRFLHMTEVTLDSGANRHQWRSSADQDADPDRFHTVAYGAGLTYEESQANARLIAAAPDLLAACKALLRWADIPADPCTPAALVAAQNAVVEIARAAIARAEKKE